MKKIKFLTIILSIVFVFMTAFSSRPTFATEYVVLSQSFIPGGGGYRYYVQVANYEDPNWGCVYGPGLLCKFSTNNVPQNPSWGVYYFDNPNILGTPVEGEYIHE